MSAQAHLDGLAKPVGSLGLLEFYAIRLCKLQDTLAPVVIAESLAVFCADHGAARPTDVGGEAVSAFPSSVTAKIVTALAHGDAAGSVIAASLGIPAERRRIVDVGVDWPPGGGRPPGLSGVGGKGTRNFAVEEAMSLEDCLAAERAGAETVRALAARHATNVVALGEVGIGNTASSSALLSALTGRPPAETVGPGTGLDAGGVLRKAAIVVRALERHRGVVARAGDDPRATLAAMGGKEMAAMVGAIHAASELRVAVIVDGFISSVAALIAVRILPPSAECLFLSTVSPERGHRLCLGALRDAIGCPADGQSAAALDMGLRLGEGTGALLCIPILRAAAAVSSHMVTLKDALER